MSLREHLDTQAKAAVEEYGWTAERIGRLPGHVYAVRDRAGYRGRLKYNQGRQEWCATSPLTKRPLGWWGTLRDAVADLLTLDNAGATRPRPAHHLFVRVDFELDEEVRRAIARRLGLDGMVDDVEFEGWLRREVEAAVAETRQLQERERRDDDGRVSEDQVSGE